MHTNLLVCKSLFWTVYQVRRFHCFRCSSSCRNDPSLSQAVTYPQCCHHPVARSQTGYISSTFELFSSVQDFLPTSTCLARPRHVFPSPSDMPRVSLLSTDYLRLGLKLGFQIFTAVLFLATHHRLSKSDVLPGQDMFSNRSFEGRATDWLCGAQISPDLSHVRVFLLSSRHFFSLSYRPPGRDMFSYSSEVSRIYIPGRSRYLLPSHNFHISIIPPTFQYSPGLPIRVGWKIPLSETDDNQAVSSHPRCSGFSWITDILRELSCICLYKIGPIPLYVTSYPCEDFAAYLSKLYLSRCGTGCLLPGHLIASCELWSIEVCRFWYGKLSSTDKFHKEEHFRMSWHN